MLEQLFETKNDTDESFIPLPSANKPRVILPVKKRFYFRKSFQIHNTSSLKNKIFKAFFIGTYPLGIWLLPQRLYAKPILNELMDFVQQKISTTGEVIVAAYWGSTGKNQKMTLQFLDFRGEILGYLKVGNNPDNKKYIQNEFEIIETVKKQLPQIHIPENAFLAEWHDWLFLFQKSVLVSLSSVKNELNSELIAVLITIAEIRGETQEWKPLLNAINGEFFRNCESKITREMREKIEKTVISLSEKNYVPILTHGDFVSYNLKTSPHGLYLYDWEFAETKDVPFYDVFHFVFQGMFQIRKMNPGKIIERYILHHHANQAYFQQYADALGIGREDIVKFFLLYLIKGLNFDLGNRPEQNISENHYFQGLQYMIENIL